MRFQTDLDYLAALEQGARAAVERGAALETAQETLAAMDYTGKGSASYSTEAFHRENIRFAYHGVLSHRH